MLPAVTRRGPNDRPNGDRTGEWLPIADAAARLGVTTDAVRMRAKRRTIPSRKNGRRLEVLVGEPNGDPTPERTPTERATQRPTQRDDDPIDVPYRVAGEPDLALVPVQSMIDGMGALAARLAELAERNEALAVEVGTLRERAGHQAETIGRLERERDELRAERDSDRRLADQLVDLLQADREGLRAELDLLRAGAEPRDAPAAQPEAPGATGTGSAPFAPSVAAWRARTTRQVDLDEPAAPVPWWRRWWRRAGR